MHIHMSIAGAARECCSTADNYTMDFRNPNPNGKNESLKVEEKMALLTGAILSDFMWFDGNTNVFDCDFQQTCKINCCFFNCMGLIVPCYIDCANVMNCAKGMAGAS